MVFGIACTFLQTQVAGKFQGIFWNLWNTDGATQNWLQLMLWSFPEHEFGHNLGLKYVVDYIWNMPTQYKLHISCRQGLKLRSACGATQSWSWLTLTWPFPEHQLQRKLQGFWVANLVHFFRSRTHCTSCREGLKVAPQLNIGRNSQWPDLFQNISCSTFCGFFE